uniref:Evasin n=1 Tax=Amblyomma cajennense TaxID=34607 RepID=A0A023FS79_AMBCJ
MTLLWIFAIVIGALASAENAAPGVAPGCGDPPAEPKDREYGRVIDGDSCEKRYLLAKGQQFLASCQRHCPDKNISYPLDNGYPCLQFMKKGFLLERDDESKNTCRIGMCYDGKCRRFRQRYPVACTVPEDKIDRSE